MQAVSPVAPIHQGALGTCVRVCVPPPHVFEQAPHAAHSLVAASLQGRLLQPWLCCLVQPGLVLPGHGRLRCFVPRPQVALQLDHWDQEEGAGVVAGSTGGEGVLRMSTGQEGVQ